jgi:hypothetical protein
MPREPDLAKREAWRRRLEEFERGNGTIAEFCRRAGVPVRSFYYWRQRVQPGISSAASHRQRHGTATADQHARFVHRSRRAGTKPTLKFVPIEITERPSIEVHLPHGARMMVPSQDRDAIGVVIAALLRDPQERQPC